MTDDLKTRLLGKRYATPSGMPEDDVEIPGVGTVRVRGLSRAEVIGLREDRDAGLARFEQAFLSLAMVDPPMSEDEIADWQACTQGPELEEITAKVNELSGLARGAGKEAYKSVRDESGAGVRALPGAEIGNDRGSAADGDVG